MIELRSDPVVFSWLVSALLLIGLLMGLPGIATVLGLMRLERGLRKLFWHFVTALDRCDRTKVIE